jgi:hypothetical protein
MLAGIVASALARRRVELPLLLFVAVYGMLIMSQTVRFERNLMPLVPIAAMLAGACFAHVWARVPDYARAPARAALALAAVLVLTVSLSASVSSSRDLTEPDTRQAARDWMIENLPADARVTREFYTPGLEGTSFKVRNTFALHGSTYEDHVAKSDYIVLSSTSFDRYFEDPRAYPERLALYDKLLGLPVVYEVLPSGEMHGPRIVIVSTNAADVVAGQ